MIRDMKLSLLGVLNDEVVKATLCPSSNITTLKYIKLMRKTLILSGELSDTNQALVDVLRDAKLLSVDERAMLRKNKCNLVRCFKSR